MTLSATTKKELGDVLTAKIVTTQAATLGSAPPANFCSMYKADRQYLETAQRFISFFGTSGVWGAIAKGLQIALTVGDELCPPGT